MSFDIRVMIRIPKSARYQTAKRKLIDKCLDIRRIFKSSGHTVKQTKKVSFSSHWIWSPRWLQMDTNLMTTRNDGTYLFGSNVLISAYVIVDSYRVFVFLVWTLSLLAWNTQYETSCLCWINNAKFFRWVLLYLRQSNSCSRFDRQA